MLFILSSVLSADKTFLKSKSTKFMLKARTMTKSQLKARAKQIPFNVSLPWGESVAAYLGVGFDQLKENYVNDYRLHETMGSACTLIRDYSIKELIQANGAASRTIKDLC